MEKRPDIVSLNALNLDIQELERRLELATAVTPDGWCDCDSQCVSYNPCTTLNCTDYCTCYGTLCDCYGTLCDCYGFTCQCDGAYLPIDIQ